MGERNLCWSCLNRYQGILCASLTGLCCAINGFLAKYLADFSSIDLNFHMNLTIMFLILPLTFYTVKNFTFERHVFYVWIAYAAFHVFGTIFRYAAFQMMPLGDASVIVFSTPIFTAVMARIVLKEHISRLYLISLASSLLGMCLTVKLPLVISSEEFRQRVGSRNHLIGCGFAFISVMGTSGVYVSLRRIKDIAPALNSLACSIIATFMCACVSGAMGKMQSLPCSYHTWLLLVIGITCLFALVLNSRAAQTEDATTIATIVRSSDIVCAFIFQIFLFAEDLDGYSISGAIVVTASGMLLPFQKWMLGLPPNSKWKSEWLLK